MVNLLRKENNVNTTKRAILGLLSAPGRYIKHKVKSNYKKIVKKEQRNC